MCDYSAKKKESGSELIYVQENFAPSLASSQHCTRNDEHRFGEKNCKTNGSETSLLVPVANQEKTKEDSDVKGTNKIATAAIKTLPPKDRVGGGSAT